MSNNVLQIISLFSGEAVQKEDNADRDARTSSSEPVSRDPTKPESSSARHSFKDVTGKKTIGLVRRLSRKEKYVFEVVEYEFKSSCLCL